MKSSWLFWFLFLSGVARLHAANITVFGASSLAEALTEAGATYEKGHQEDKVRFNLAGSNALVRQIKEGAPADIFFSADEAKMDEVEKAGLLVPGTRRNRLSNTLVIIVPAEGGLKVADAADLARPEFKQVALGDPKAVPAGIYAREYLARRGFWEVINSKTIPSENVRAAMAAVASGNAEAGIVYKTDAAASSKVKVALEVSGAEAPKIRYPVAALKEAPEPAAAQRFLAFLLSPEAGEIFRRRGFVVLDADEKK